MGSKHTKKRGRDLVIDYELELQRIDDMELKQILLKAQAFRRYEFMSIEEYHGIKQRIESRLQFYGYAFVPACCGRFSVQKIN